MVLPNVVLPPRLQIRLPFTASPLTLPFTVWQDGVDNWRHKRGKTWVERTIYWKQQ